MPAEARSASRMVLPPIMSAQRHRRHRYHLQNVASPAPVGSVFPLGVTMVKVVPCTSRREALLTGVQHSEGGTLHVGVRSAYRVVAVSSSNAASTRLSSSSMISLHRPGWMPPMTWNTSGPEHNWNVLTGTSS